MTNQNIENTINEKKDIEINSEQNENKKNYDENLFNNFSLALINQIPTNEKDFKKIDYEQYKKELEEYIQCHGNIKAGFAINNNKFDKDLFSENYCKILNEIKVLAKHIESLIENEQIKEESNYLDENIKSLIEGLKANKKLEGKKHNRLKVVEVFRYWILKNIYYDKSDNVLQDGFDVFYTKIGNCRGCANLFKILCDMIEIPCIILNATAHQFVGVLINNKWICIDPTANEDNEYHLYDDIHFRNPYLYHIIVGKTPKDVLIDSANEDFIKKCINHKVLGYSYNLRDIPVSHHFSNEYYNYIDEDKNSYHISSCKDDGNFYISITLNQQFTDIEKVKDYAQKLMQR